MRKYIEYVGKLRDDGIYDGGFHLDEDDIGSINLDEVFRGLSGKKVKIVAENDKITITILKEDVEG